MIGLSIRLALALGLHLRNEDPTVSDSRRSTLVHTWWTLHSIECLVSTITGRPPVISIEDCTVRLPQSLPDETLGSRRTSDPSSSTRSNPQGSSRSRNNSTTSNLKRLTASPTRYFVGHINNALTSQKALLNLYSPRIAARAWEVSVPLILFAIRVLHDTQEYVTVVIIAHNLISQCSGSVS